MAFDVSKLFSPEAFNMLLQPGVLPPDTRNMLLSREIPTDPSANPPMAIGMPPQQAPQPQQAQIPVPTQDPRLAAAPQPQMAPQQMMPALGQDSPRIYNPQMVAANGQPQGTDPMTTASVGQPQQGQPAGQPGLLGGLRSFIDGDRGQYFHDMFTGWASGSNPGESLGNGAKLAGANYTTHQQTNQTVDWLKSKGMADDQAHLLAGNPTALGDYLKQIYSPKAQGEFHQLDNGDYGVVLNGQFVKQGNAAKATGPGGGEFGLNPIYGTDAKTGKTGIGQVGKDGTFHVVDTGGFQPVGNVSTTDLGTTSQVKDKAGNIISNTPIDNQGAAFAKKLGTDTGEQQAGRVSAGASLGSTLSGLDRLDKSAADIQADPYLNRVTGWEGVLPSAPGGHAASAQARLNTLKSQIGFNVLSAMREASKTGGALGSVSDKENELLQNNLAALDQAQNEDDLRKQIGVLRDYVTGAKQRLSGAYKQMYGSDYDPNGNAAPSTGSPAHIDDLLKKYGGQ